MTWCVVPGCRNIVRQRANLVFYRFPKYNRKLLALWLTAIGKESWEPHKWSAICCDHFIESDFIVEVVKGVVVKSLKPHAVPTKYLPPRKAHICSVHGIIPAGTTFCCVSGCSVKSTLEETTLGTGPKFHPLSIKHTITVCSCVNLPSKPSLAVFRQKKLQICQKHFVKNAVGSYICEEGIDLTNDDDNSDSIQTYSIVTTDSSSCTTRSVTQATNNISLAPSTSQSSASPNIFTKRGSKILKQAAGTVATNASPSFTVKKSKFLISSTPKKSIKVAPKVPPVSPVLPSIPEEATDQSWSSKLQRGDIIVTNNNQVLQILGLTDNVSVNDIKADKSAEGRNPARTSRYSAVLPNKQGLSNITTADVPVANIFKTEEELSRLLQNGDDVCRVCFATGELRPVNQKTFFGDFCIFDMLNACIKLREPIEKQFPQNICFVCLKNLKAAYLFLNQCEKSTNMLKKIISLTQEYLPVEHDYYSSKDPLMNDNNDDNGFDANGFDDGDTVDPVDKTIDKVDKIETVVPSESNLLLEALTAGVEEVKPEYITVDIKDIGAPEHLCELTNKNISQKELPKEILDKIDDKSTIIADESIPKHIFNQITEKSTVQHDGKSYVLAKAYSCHKCKELFFDKEKLKAHNCNPIVSKDKQPVKIKTTASARLLKCKKCFKLFCSNQQLGKHSCRTITMLQCKKCKRRFKYGSSFTKHSCSMVPRKKKKKYPCKICKEVFLTSQKLTEHKNTLHPIAKTYKCRRCKIAFKTKEEFITHGKEEHKSGSVPCGICHKSIKRENISKHRQVHNGELNYCCEYCGKRFKYPANLRHHHRIHLDIRPYVCDICGKGFRIRSKQKEHRLIHFPERKYMCDICGATFRQKVGLASHKQKNRCFKSKGVNAPPNPQECDICQVMVMNRTQLNEHKKKEHRIEIPARTKTFRCEVCNQQFLSKLALNSHEYLHGTKSRKCSSCSRSFFTIDRLQKHMKVHLIEKKYPCPHCDKRFSTTATLRAHIVVHTGEKNFSCTYCSKNFAQSAHLMAHERTHTGQRPYQCPHCPRAFALSGNLTSHIRTHTGERPYECRFCPQAFFEASAAKKHMQSKHSLELIYAND